MSDPNQTTNETIKKVLGEQLLQIIVLNAQLQAAQERISELEGAAAPMKNGKGQTNEQAKREHAAT